MEIVKPELMRNPLRPFICDCREIQENETLVDEMSFKEAIEFEKNISCDP
jgi:hypothetical protein